MKKVESIKRFVSVVSIITILFLSAAGCEQKEAKEKVNKGSNMRTIVDMAERKVDIPKDVKKVYSVEPVGTTLLYTLAPDKLAGWNYKLTEGEKRFIVDKYEKLPVLGGWFGKGNTGNIEQILKADPNLIIYSGTINKTNIESANNIQEQSGVPVFMIAGDNITEFDELYKVVGRAINEEEKAAELAEYCRDTINEVTKKAKEIPEDKCVKVYYAEGPNGLQTDPEGSSHTEVLKLVGGINAAKVDKDKGYGREKVSIEQVLSWNPEIIITEVESNSDDKECFYNLIFKDEAWKEINAVKNGKVYGIPQNPFSWFDRPPSVNRMIGMKWLGNLLYPDTFNYDISEEVKNFYDKFYHYKLSDQEVKELLKTSSTK